MNHRIPAIVLAALACAPFAAQAQDHGRHHNDRGPGRFQHWDINQDGIVIREELIQRATDAAGDLFTKLDADQDGKITPEEAAAPRRARQDRMRQQADKRFAAASSWTATAGSPGRRPRRRCRGWRRASRSWTRTATDSSARRNWPGARRAHAADRLTCRRR
jgi:hypothetical protein